MDSDVTHLIVLNSRTGKDHMKTDIIIQGSCVDKLASLPDRSVDLVFADPPYNWDKHEALADALIQKGFLKEGGEAIIEHSADTDLSHLPGFFEHRKYGHVHFSFFSRQEQFGS